MFHKHSWFLQAVFNDSIYPIPKKGNWFTRKGTWYCNCGATKTVIVKEKTSD